MDNVSPTDFMTARVAVENYNITHVLPVFRMNKADTNCRCPFCFPSVCPFGICNIILHIEYPLCRFGWLFVLCVNTCEQQYKSFTLRREEERERERCRV